MPYAAVVFDLDGTLLDTLDDLADASNGALAALGQPTHPTDAYRVFVGDGVRNLARRALPADARGDEALVDRLVEETRSRYARNWADTTRPYPGVPELLDALAARGLPMAVFSNKPHDATLRCVERLLPDHSFAAVLGHREGKPVKPDPGGALEIAAGLGVTPGDCLYLGDTDTDMATAVAAGMFAVGAVWGFRTADELRSAGARALAEHPRDVLALVDGAEAGGSAGVR